MLLDNDARQPLQSAPRKRGVRGCCASLGAYLGAEFAGDRDGPRKFYKGQYARALAWSAVLLLGWGFTRLTCTLGVPSDCNLANSPLEYMSDVQILLTYGLVQAWFCDVLERERFWNLFSWPRWYFFASFLSGGLAFSVVGDMPGLGSSLSSGSSYTVAQVALYASVGIVALWVLCWHFWYARRVYSAADVLQNFRVYAWSRGATYLFFLLYTLAVVLSGASFEFHHYFLAWVVSLSAQFRHGLSVITLGVTAGIFVQGLGAYRSAFLFYEHG